MVRLQRRRWFSRPLNLFLIVALLVSSIYPVALSAAREDEGASGGYRDLEGHWAEDTLRSWIERGLLTGYPDGTVRPNQVVTRAEFAALVNRLFQFNVKVGIDFADVSDEWFRDTIAVAVAAGYLSGYPDGTIRPNGLITRQEAASIVARILNLGASDAEGLLRAFSDANDIAAWARNAVAAVVERSIMGGYPDGTFRPGKALTRAEAVVILDNAFGSGSEPTVLAINKPGAYGSLDADKPEEIAGNAAINVPDVLLQNVVIHGNLVLGEGIGEGDVTLRNVTVHGTTTILGGIGVENLIKLSQYAAGNVIYIPRPDYFLRPIRNQKIKQEFNGNNVKELCRKYALSERQVRHIVRTM